MKSRIIMVAALASITAACQYKAEPMSVGAYNVYSSYGDKLPGKYLLYVDASALKKAIKPSDMNCAAHTYPLDLTAGFTGSVRKTFETLVSETEVVAQPVDRADLAARGARGMIIVRGEEISGRLRVVPGFWAAGMETEVELVASITVDGRSGRLLGSTVSGNGNAQGDAGGFCEGGAKALVESAEKAMKQSVGRLGEALTNSERVRKGS
ncbi:hypothetical protein [Mesorhizobium sp. YR577]|uniref:hypothetical protein n=1 Tax=Mesorhizobium sp. YR577 TaxID=1884373 RepID=UPI0008EAF634|nr:hypothetical protein [Mesorhizobium sp. YR577]SFU22517.1 hypothetical protein SAMN05518861_13637 [Mesorhizobium sp. YR577]